MGYLNVFAQRKNNNKKGTPISTESMVILPDEVRENYPYKIDVRLYVGGNYQDRRLITVIPLKIGERVRGTLDYNAVTGKINIYVKKKLVATKLTRPWDKLLPKIVYGYGVKFELKESETIDFLFTPQISASSVDEYEVFNKYDTTWGAGLKIYHDRR